MPLSAVAFQSPRPSVLGHSSPVSSLLRIFLSDTPTPLMNTPLSNIPVLSLLYSAPQGLQRPSHSLAPLSPVLLSLLILEPLLSTPELYYPLSFIIPPVRPCLSCMGDSLHSSTHPASQRRTARARSHSAANCEEMP